MKLKDLLKVVDPIVNVNIWTHYDDGDKLSFSGSVLNIPWIYLDFKIGFPKRKDEGELPIYIGIDTNENGVDLPYMAINLIGE